MTRLTCDVLISNSEYHDVTVVAVRLSLLLNRVKVGQIQLLLCVCILVQKDKILGLDHDGQDAGQSRQLCRLQKPV